MKPAAAAERAPTKFPFSTSFQFRDDERSGLEALFERAFFDRAFGSAEAAALSRIRYTPPDGRRSPEARADDVRRADEGKLGASPGGPERGGGARYVILCRGANGIGKTRIFRPLREGAQRRNMPVYEVYHHDVEGIPFKPFLHTIRRILRDHDPGAVLQKKYRYGLADLLPEVFGRGAGPEGGEAPPSSTRISAPERFEAEKVRVFDAITQLLLEVTARKPLLILVHDLHWSDSSTIALLRYIGRNLQLRSSRSGRRGSRQLHLDAGLGPEIEGFEGEEWRTLSRRSPQASGYLGGLPTDEDPSRTEKPAGPEARVPFTPSRLMILANYRGFPEPTHYLEQAIVKLGEEPYAFHAELRTLGPEEADRFIPQSVEGVEVAGQALQVRPEAVRAIHEAAEGFPSFAHELLRALYLHNGGANGAGDGEPAWVWTAEKIRVLLDEAAAGVPAAAAPAAESAADAAAPTAQPAPAGAAEVAGNGSLAPAMVPEEPRAPLSRRHAILRLRLLHAAPEELRLLRLLTVARRPLTAAFAAQVLEAPVAGVEETLRRLEELGLLEVAEVGGDASPGEGGEGAERFFFRLWDYTRVVDESLPAEERKRLHQRFGDALRALPGGVSDENAFEVYYHLYRGDEPRTALPYGLLAARRFCRSFALEKARRVYGRLESLLTCPEDCPQRVELLEETARLSLALKETTAAEEALKRAEVECGPSLPPERRAEIVFLEAEAAATADPGRALKVLSRGARHVSDENTPLGVRLQLLTARLRFLRGDIKRAVNFSLKGISICQKLEALPELGELYRVLASAFYRKGDYSHAVDNYQRALDAFDALGLKEAAVDTLEELGRVYLERGHHFRAARFLYKALEIRRRLHDVAGLCRSYDQLALVYLRSGDDLKTIENLNRTLALKERIGDFAGLNPTLAALGELYARLGSYEQSIFYFRWEVENSQSLGDTPGLVEAFAKLGRVYFEVGDLKAAESLAKQVAILASEFKLRAHEADGASLAGRLRALQRDWTEAEKSLRSAADVYAKLGDRRQEACAVLDMAELKLNRELYDESLKFASKGQIAADELKALDLQVRASILKGNIHRFLKGGNAEKAAESLRKALELSQNLSDATVLFDLYYSLAKTCHSQREFAEASNYYGKAELVLKKIGDDLTDELAARFFEDERRKVFAEDLARFRKEAAGRAPGVTRELREPGVLAAGIKERPCTLADYKDLCARILRVHANLYQLHFHDRLLAETLELTGADRGFVLRVHSRQYVAAAFQGFGKNPAQHPEFMAGSHLAQEAIRKGRSILASGSEAEVGGGGKGKDRRLQIASCLVHRSLLAVPFMTEERIFGGVYLDKPVALGHFVARDQILMETFAQHAAVTLNNRREFETTIRDPLTGFYTPSYFVDRLREAYRWFNLHGKVFVLLGYYLPNLEEALGDGRGQLGGKLAQDLAEILPLGAAVSWGNPVLYILFGEGEAPLAGEVAEEVRTRLGRILNDDVPMTLLPAEGHFQNGAEVYLEVRRRLLPEEGEQRVFQELRGILAPDITLRDAKRIVEKFKIEMTLRKTGGNITRAARELGVHRPQLSNLLKKHELKRELFEEEA